MDITKVHFVTSVVRLSQLPDDDLPEVAFAGRSNVGKSSLINRLVNRRNLVKVSSRPGKTQALNYFLVNERFHLVDLPGYGFARVPKRMQGAWQKLIASYLEQRTALRLVVVIVDLRHPVKAQDLALVSWLREHRLPALVVYTKADKLSRNQQSRQAAVLDKGFGLSAEQRVLFSSKTGTGREILLAHLDRFLA